MENESTNSQKFGQAVRRYSPYSLLIGPILIVEGFDGNGTALLGAILLGSGLYALAIALEEKT